MMIDLQTPNLRKRRKDLKLTLKDVASIVGVSEGTVSRWETGNISSMRPEHSKLLAQALKTSIRWVAGSNVSHSLENLLDELVETATKTNDAIQELHDDFSGLKENMEELSIIINLLKEISPIDYADIINYLNYTISKK